MSIPASAPALPGGWQKIRLTEVAQLESGHTPSRSKPSYWNGGVPWISLHDSDSLDSKEIVTTNQTVTMEGINNSSARLLPKGTVVFSRTATVGKATVMGREMATSQDFANYICGPKVHNHYLVHLFRFMAPEWKRLMAGSIHNTVYMPVFEKLEVILPPRSEQEAIASAIDEADASLLKTDALIAKKRDFKQGVVQRLISGEARLPGFSGEWRSRPLGELLSYEQPTKYIVRTSEYSDANDMPVLTAGKTFILGYTKEMDGVVTDLPVIIFDDFTTDSKYVTFPFKVKSSAMKLLRARESSCHLGLLYELMQLVDFQLGDHKRYWISEYQHIKVKVPEPAEQRAIAFVLSEMDAEIAGLEAQRNKAFALKQGMMQQLLTGRIRLI